MEIENKIKTYRDLDVWKIAMDVTVDIYKLTSEFPKNEIYGLTNQIQRAAVSIPANIAEGHGRLHIKEYINHLSISRGSLTELETHLILSQRLGYTSRELLIPIWNQLQSIGKMINQLMKSLKAINKNEKD